MSKGSPIIRVRVPAALLAQVEAKVERSQDSKDEPYTLSSWIISAIREKLYKNKRSSTRPKHRQKGGEDSPKSKIECSSGPAGDIVASPDIS
jgi:hypothetical protein